MDFYLKQNNEGPLCQHKMLYLTELHVQSGALFGQMTG